MNFKASRVRHYFDSNAVMKTPFAKSELAHPIITSIDFQRPTDVDNHKIKLLEWSVRVVEEGKMGGGTYVTFDAKGNFLATRAPR